jgi:hypothetical protein
LDAGYLTAKTALAFATVLPAASTLPSAKASCRAALTVFASENPRRRLPGGAAGHLVGPQFAADTDGAGRWGSAVIGTGAVAAPERR